MIINIRGTNGSGKTTLVRKLLGESTYTTDLLRYHSPTKKDPSRVLYVPATGGNDYLAIGSYRQGCGGMDTIPSFELQQGSITAALTTLPNVGHIVCEGDLASTVAGSWLEFFKDPIRTKGQKVLVAYLDTPIELCLERIRARQIAAKGVARDIKVELVENKIKSIHATRAKFKAAGIATTVLRHGSALEDLMSAISAVEAGHA